MKKLIITAHPHAKGFTHAIAKAYKKGSEKSKHKVEILDLYKRKPAERFLSFKKEGHVGDLPESKDGQKRIKAANEIVLIFPVWWYDAPAILKNFFDYTLINGFAMKFQKTGAPIGLLKDKTVRIFCTSFAPSFPYYLRIMPLIGVWKARLGLCGMKIKNFTIFGRINKKTEEDKKQLLKKVEEMGAEK